METINKSFFIMFCRLKKSYQTSWTFIQLDTFYIHMIHSISSNLSIYYLPIYWAWHYSSQACLLSKINGINFVHKVLWSYSNHWLSIYFSTRKLQIILFQTIFKIIPISSCDEIPLIPSPTLPPFLHNNQYIFYTFWYFLDNMK